MTAAGNLALWTLAGAVAMTPELAESWREVVDSPFVLPSGVADAGGRSGFLANAEGGITAVDLRNGKVLWESKAARRPIVFANERLYASVPSGPGQLRVVALDAARKGCVVFQSESITVPPCPPHRCGILHWSLAGDLLRLSGEVAGESSGIGGATVDLRSGHVQPLPEQAPATEAVPPADLSGRVVRWRGVVGGAYKALVLEDTATGEELVLRAWSVASGQALPAKPLLQGKRLLVRATLNDQYLCLRDAAPGPDQNVDRRDRYAWSIFDAGTGERVARLPHEPGTQAITVLGPRAFYLVTSGVPGSVGQPFVSRRFLKAADLQTGKTLWEREVEGKRVTPVGT